MKRLMKRILAAALALAATAAWGTYHTFQIEEVFSNADGTIQYVVLHESMGMDGENMLSGHSLVAIQGALTHTYNFINDLPGGECDAYACTLAMTAHKRVLIGTQGFAALNIVTPDYVVPNGFVPLGSGTLNYAGVDLFAYAGLPTDGVSAVSRSGAIVPNIATNFAGTGGSVSVAGGSTNYEGLWWASPASSESGWGINFAHQGDTIFASWFTYDLTGKGLWLVMTAAEDRAQRLFGHALRDDRSGVQRGAVRAGAGSRDRGRPRDDHLHRRQRREFRVHGERRSRKRRPSPGRCSERCRPARPPPVRLPRRRTIRIYGGRRPRDPNPDGAST